MIYKTKVEALSDERLMTYLKAKDLDWMLECLGMNPTYTDWGNGQEMMEYGDWWDGAIDVEDVSELIPLDELNELAHFYFYIDCPKDVWETVPLVYEKQKRVSLGLQLWILHPRKSTGKGMRVQEIERSEVNNVISYLQEAGEMIDDHFAGLEFI